MQDEVVLRPVAEEHLPVLERIRADPGLAGEFQWYGYRDPAALRRRWADTGLLGDDGGLLMVLRGGQPLGFVSWRRIVTSISSHCWNIGVQLLPEFHRQGHGTRAQRMLAEYLFAHTQVNRIEAVTDVDNAAENRALAKAGFRREGVLRGHSYRLGGWHDSVIYSVLRGELD